VALAIGLATSGFAYLASNGVDPSNAGMGHATISGYDISNVTYSTGTTDDHHTVASVQFTLAAHGGPGLQPSHVWAQIQHASTTSELGSSDPSKGCKLIGAWSGGSGTYSCQANDTIPIHDADQLTVIAYQ